MPRLKVLSGDDLIKIFGSFGFSVIGQKGSHVKLRRINPRGFNETLTIPRHKELDRGTLKAIYHQALRYVSEPDLAKFFYIP